MNIKIHKDVLCDITDKIFTSKRPRRAFSQHQHPPTLQQQLCGLISFIKAGSIFGMCSVLPYDSSVSCLRADEIDDTLRKLEDLAKKNCCVAETRSRACGITEKLALAF